MTVATRPYAEIVKVGILGSAVPSGAIVRIRKREDVVLARQIAGEMLVFARTRLAKAALPALLEQRDKAFAQLAPELASALVEYFDGFLARAGISKAAEFPLDADDIDWKTEGKLLAAALESVYLELGELAWESIGEELGVSLSFALDGPATKAIRDRLATQVSLITDATREIIRDRVEAAVAGGLSIEQLVEGTSELMGLADLMGSRAQTIALTETATAYNSAAVAAYRDSGLIDEVLVFDGSECGWTEHDDPDLADGSTRTLDEADEFPVSHPNCQRAFGAVVAR